MSLFCRSLRPRTTDDAVERYLVSLQTRIAPDPLFRRRLRSQAINRFVAAREQQRTDLTPATMRQMGRIGRACLYASLALATSAAGVLGASQEALPGDALYAVKLRIEQLRFRALPVDLHGVLSANVLTERLEEMTRLLDSGRTGDAAALQPAIATEIEHLGALQAAGSADAGSRVASHLLVVDELINRLPDAAEEAVRGAWDQLPSGSGGASAPGPAAPAGSPSDNGHGGPNHPAIGPNPSAPGQAIDSHEPKPTKDPDRGKPGDPGAGAPGEGKDPPGGTGID